MKNANFSKIRPIVHIEPGETRVFFDGKRYRFVVGGPCQKCAFYDPNADGSEETGCRLAAATLRGESPYFPCSRLVRRDGTNGNFQRVKRSRTLDRLGEFFRRVVCPFARVALIAAALFAAPTFAAEKTTTFKAPPVAETKCAPDEEKIAAETARLYICVFERPACPPCAALKPEITAFRKTGLAPAIFANVLESKNAAIANSLGIRTVPVVYLLKYLDERRAESKPIERIELGPSPLASITSAVVAERARIRAANVVCSVDDAADLVPELPEKNETPAEPAPEAPSDSPLIISDNADFQFGADVFRESEPEPESEPPKLEAETKPELTPPVPASDLPAVVDFRDRPAVRETARPGILDVRPNEPAAPEPSKPTAPPTDDAKIGDRVIARIVAAFEKAVDAKIAVVVETFEQKRRRLVVLLLSLLFASQIVAIFVARVVAEGISYAWRVFSGWFAKTLAAAVDRAQDVARNAAESYLERTEKGEDRPKESNKI